MLGYDQQFSLHSLGLPVMHSLSVLDVATKARYFFNHSQHIEALHAQLSESVDNLSGLDLFHLSKTHWTWSPCITNIINSHSNSSCQNAIQSAQAEGPVKLQGRIRALLHSEWYFDDFQELLVDRCTKYFPDEDFKYSLVNFHNIFEIASSMGTHICATIFKTLAGGWNTSRRWQRPVLPCIFCCDEHSDSLQHYVHCDRLWYAISQAFPPFSPHFFLPSLLGLSPPSPYQLYGLHLAFHCFHSLRTHAANSVQDIINIALQTFQVLFKKWIKKSHEGFDHENGGSDTLMVWQPNMVTTVSIVFWPREPKSEKSNADLSDDPLIWL